MSFNGTEGSAIDSTTAGQLTDAYRAAYPGTTKGVFIGKDNILKLLNQTDSKGIRVYFGRDDANQNTIVMVAANSNEDDIMDFIVNRGCLCPNRCGCATKLNV